MEAFFLLVYFLIAQPVKVAGDAMLPNYPGNAYYIIRKLPIIDKNPHRGDVVLYSFFTSPEQQYVKRVIGLPGDKIEIREGRVYINDKVLDEPYLSPGTQTRAGKFLEEGKPFVVWKYNYIVMGDNRDNSSDSRSRGLVASDDIKGKVWFCYRNCPQNKK